MPAGRQPSERPEFPDAQPMPPEMSVGESLLVACGPSALDSGGTHVARRPDGAALQTALLVASAVAIAVLVALALMQWFGRLT